MIKWLVVISVIAFVYYFFIKQKPQIQKKSQQKKEDTHEMVECSRCGVFVEVQEAILSNGKYYCSKECIKGIT